MSGCTYESLDLVAAEANVVFDYDIMRWPSCTLQALMSLQVEFPPQLVGDTAVDHGARPGVETMAIVCVPVST